MIQLVLKVLRLDEMREQVYREKFLGFSLKFKVGDEELFIKVIEIVKQGIEIGVVQRLSEKVL